MNTNLSEVKGQFDYRFSQAVYSCIYYSHKTKGKTSREGLYILKKNPSKGFRERVRKNLKYLDKNSTFVQWNIFFDDPIKTIDEV